MQLNIQNNYYSAENIIKGCSNFQVQPKENITGQLYINIKNKATIDIPYSGT